jgi:hypothetical protein
MYDHGFPTSQDSVDSLIAYSSAASVCFPSSAVPSRSSFPTPAVTPTGTGCAFSFSEQDIHHSRQVSKSEGQAASAVYDSLSSLLLSAPTAQPDTSLEDYMDQLLEDHLATLGAADIFPL